MNTDPLAEHAAALAEAERYALAARAAAMRGQEAEAEELRGRMAAVFERVEEALDKRDKETN